MAVRRRAFALILVLVVASATFALAIQGAVAVRSATVEAATMRARAAAERDAMSVATLLLASLTSGGQTRDDLVGAGASSGGATTPDLDENELPEMHPQMRELVRGLLRDDPQAEPGDGAGASRGLARIRSGGPYTTLRERGLPRAAIRVSHDDRAYHVSIADAAGGLNLNVAEEDQLVRYFRAVGLDTLRATAIAHELLDWRDEDNVPRTYGAEREIYLRLNITPRNGLLQTIDELLYLPSMTRELLESIRPDLTLLGDGSIHVPSASRAVLLSAPDMTEQAAGRVLAMRSSDELTMEMIEDALGVMARDASEILRLQPSSTIMLHIEPVGEGPAYRVDAAISDDRGVRLLGVRMVPRT